MSATTKELLKTLTNVITDRFADQGFSLKKDRHFEKVSETGRVYRYSMKLSKVKGWFTLHLTLHLIDGPLMAQVNRILEKALRDESINYPDSFSQPMIEDIIKTRTSNNVATELTDWRILKNVDEALEEFNARFSIWLYSFDELDEKPNWEQQLFTSIDLAVTWFEMVDSDSWIEENAEYPSLYLLSKKPSQEDLKSRYEQLLKKCSSRQELELFYQHLLQKTNPDN